MKLNSQGATALLMAAALLSACVSQSTYNQEVQKTRTYQQLDAQLKGESPPTRRRSRNCRTWCA